jgi:nanoRNase/pAp phosphatase (c-di-AMP/oligoRNAs hydrolase)
VSFRAKSFDVGNFCASFAWWGGHKLAAGLKSKKGIKELEKEILEKLKEQI